MEDIKKVVQEKYGQIATQTREQNAPSCCGSVSCGSIVDYSVFSENYEDQKGYVPDADLGLGCGLPTEYAGIKPGNTVLDLGSGAGNDCFVARALVGDEGYVAGIDFTEAMVEKARKNTRKLGYSNVDFILGDIENIPVRFGVVDVVISNCVLNLVPDKQKAFSEIYRVLKQGGHFCISDVVLQGELPNELKEDVAMYAGCVAGALQQEEYLGIIKQSGFINVEVKKEKKIELPDDLLLKYLSVDKLEKFKNGETGIFSITVTAQKPEGCGCGCSCS
ncbi:MAG: arsenite methyltransferase [Bacteroidales bacterium]